MTPIGRRDLESDQKLSITGFNLDGPVEQRTVLARDVGRKKNDLLSSVYQLIQALYTILNSSSWWQQRHIRSLEFILSLIRLLGPSDRCFRSSLVFLFCFSTDNKSPFSQASRYIVFQIEKSQVALLFLKAILFDCCLVVQRYPLSSICGSHIKALHSCTCVNFFPVLSLKISQS